MFRYDGRCTKCDKVQEIHCSEPKDTGELIKVKEPCACGNNCFEKVFSTGKQIIKGCTTPCPKI